MSSSTCNGSDKPGKLIHGSPNIFLVVLNAQHICDHAEEWLNPSWPIPNPF